MASLRYRLLLAILTSALLSATGCGDDAPDSGDPHETQPTVDATGSGEAEAPSSPAHTERSGSDDEVDYSEPGMPGVSDPGRAQSERSAEPGQPSDPGASGPFDSEPEPSDGSPATGSGSGSGAASGASASTDPPPSESTSGSGPGEQSQQTDTPSDIDTSRPVDSSDQSAPMLGQAAMPCDEEHPCNDEFVCVYLSGAHEVGFCAPTCEALHTTCGWFGPGVHAECSLELQDGTLACGFVCVLNHGDHVHNYSCPTGDWGRLRCERSSRAFGHRFCAPDQP